MKSPLDDTIWGASYGSVAAVQAAFDRFGPEYHQAIIASGVPAGAAKALRPHLTPDAQGIDFGCGSGVLGLALREEGLNLPLDGIDLSPRMLEMARGTGCYRHLYQANLLMPQQSQAWSSPYDFAVSVGLIGDYIPYYLGLPLMAKAVRPGGIVAYAVERRSTPSHALERHAAELHLVPISESVLPVAAGKLEAQVYHFFVARVPDHTSPQ